MITMYKVVTRKDKVDSNLWFVGTAQRVGAQPGVYIVPRS